MAPELLQQAWEIFMHHSLRFASGVAMIGAALVTVAAESPRIVAVRTTADQRNAYLAQAVIWRSPDPLSPVDLLDGPSGAFPYTFAQANDGTGIGCAFAQTGQKLGGKSPKFLCLADDRQSLRLKYWDPQLEQGNREVFATVAATRLMWALGFAAVPVMPVDVRCHGCPANPMTGEGPIGERRYVALMPAELSKPVIVSKDDTDQGWSWRELHDAIESLPMGGEKVRQHTYLDALTLLGVMIQHGDRKAQQQALYCDGAVRPNAGSFEAVKGTSDETILIEREGAPACSNPAVAIVDIGATFGGAGRLSKDGTAKMNLEEWAHKPVFKETVAMECRGDLTVSLAAGDEGDPDPVISETGRRFLLEQLRRLTPDHLRALFRAARVDQLGDAEGTGSPRGSPDAVEEWVGAFQDKVRQIELRRCGSAS
jgi:hypothetical protein